MTRGVQVAALAFITAEAFLFLESLHYTQDELNRVLILVPADMRVDIKRLLKDKACDCELGR